MVYLEQDLSWLNLPTEAKHWTLAGKKPGKWFRRIEEAAQMYMERWFVTEKELAETRRALEVRTAPQPKTSLNLRPGGRRKRSRVEGGVGAAARPVNKVK
ncbi:unnamed protein product [Laminaria digitata]